MKAMIAEFVATFALVFVGVGAIAADYITAGNSGLVGIALAHGLTLAVMVGAVAWISGGHVNPAVTIGVLVARKIAPAKALGYIVSQCLGGIAAAALIKLCLPASALTQIHMGTPALGLGVSVGQGLLTEIVLTFFLMFVIYGAAIDERSTKLGGLHIGLALTLGILVGGPITGAALNPARHLGPALLGGGLENLWLYWVGPIAGAVLAVLIYQHTLERKKA